jgi:hypothetical protein
MLLLKVTVCSGQRLVSTWPEGYSVRQDREAGRLVLSTRYYAVQHDLKRGGVIAGIRLTHGRASNLLASPIVTRVCRADGTVCTDDGDPEAQVTHRREDLAEVVTVEARLVPEGGGTADIRVKSVFEYHWGYLKVHREYLAREGAVRVREVCPFSTVLTPSLSEYGYRDGATEQEGAAPFAFGSNRWGKLRLGKPTDPSLSTSLVPRSMLFADPGVEGLEWFVSSELAQWDLQLTGRRGQGRCFLRPNVDPPGLALAVSPFSSTNGVVTLPQSCTFDFYLGLPLREGHALPPWFHTSFNRNRGNWVSTSDVRRWAESGIQTVHCHNDGDYYGDGLFWRDGSYPPYPDMPKFDEVIAACQRAGIRVATYFSNKELHPSTPEFREYGSAWGRQDLRGNLQHNFFRGTNEFGVQMCLRSGWLDFLKFSIDRVLQKHTLDGVYYDWNVALLCHNRRHIHQPADAVAAAHWDIGELLDLMEWTRRRVGPRGLVIVHNTTTPMFATENFADYVVANEWGYGRWKEPGPELAELPLEWSLVGARSRGVISYGQIDAQAARSLHRRFALEALLAGVTPWPASRETFELFPVLRPIGDLTSTRYLDWRNTAVSLNNRHCASSVYGRPEEAYVVVANLDAAPQAVECRVALARLPFPLRTCTSAALHAMPSELSGGPGLPHGMPLDLQALIGQGVTLTIPARSAVLVHVR